MSKIATAKSKIHGKPFCVQMWARPLIGKDAYNCINSLSVTPGQKYVKHLKSLILSAVNNLTKDLSKLKDITIKEISVGRASRVHRIEFKGRGRVGSYDKAFCNMRCTVEWKGEI